MLWWAWKSNFL